MKTLIVCLLLAGCTSVQSDANAPVPIVKFKIGDHVALRIDIPTLDLVAGDTAVVVAIGTVRNDPNVIWYRVLADKNQLLLTFNQAKGKIDIIKIK